MLFQATYQGIAWGCMQDWAAAMAELRAAVETMQPERTLITFLAEMKHAVPGRPFCATDGTHTFSLVAEFAEMPV